MPFYITDPRTGISAFVTDEGQLVTQSEIHFEMRQHCQEEEAFIFGSDFVALTTTGSFSGIFYMKNTSENKNFFVNSIRTCANVISEWELYKNPTTGTLISNATAGLKSNSNFSSAATFTGDVYKGADAYTVTDGTQIGSWINNVGHSLENLYGGILLGPGDSLAITCKPAGAGDVCVKIDGWQTLETTT